MEKYRGTVNMESQYPYNPGGPIQGSLIPISPHLIE